MHGGSFCFCGNFAVLSYPFAELYKYLGRTPVNNRIAR